MTEVTPQFDAIIHAPNRLHICGILAMVKEMEFRVLAEQLGVSDSVLSKHIKSLVTAGYVAACKRQQSGRPRTWAMLTDDGRAAYEGHVAALKAIVNLA